MLHAEPGLTGVVGGSGIAATLSLALQLHPSVARVFVVAQAPDAALQASMQETLQGLPRKVELAYLSARPLARLLAAVKAIPARSLVLFVRYSQEDAGQVLFPRDIARQVATASPVPVYGIVEGYLGSGIVGGAIYAPDALGTRVGEIVRQILEGTPAHDIPLERATVVPTFDWRQLRRWRIDESLLPTAADVRFRTPTEWEAYRWFILGTLSLVILQTTLIASLLAQRRRRRRAEAVIGANEAALRTSYKRIRHLAGQLINAQEEARARIARDLHDDVCQELAGVSIAVSNLKRWRRNLQDPLTQEALSTLQLRAIGMVDRVRSLSHDLHPGMLRHAGLAGALEAYCIEIEQRYDMQVSFKAEGDLRHISDDAALCLFRICQEALRNAATHGRARRVTVLASRTPRYAELTVTDDGIGFDVEAVRHDGGGLGLLSIEERAYLIEGRAHIITEPGKGTTVHVMVPSCARIEPERKVAEEETGGHAPALLSAARSGGRDEFTQSPDCRRPQVVRRGHRSTAQGSLRDCRHGRRREPATRGRLPTAS